jgi:gentisate 1,2-dioxygenase
MTTTDAALDRLYRDFAAAGLLPLWTQREGLMPTTPQPAARAHVWRWADLYPIAARAGELVPVGRGGERRAIALANPGLNGEPYATPTLWAAIQYLGPREVAPAHRHTQGAFRFVVEGDGVWTVVNGDPVAMRRGDLLLTPSWAFHEHHNPTDRPMAWLDGLDIPLVAGLDAGFFEYGADTISDTGTPELSRGERLWAHPGLRPLASVTETPASSPLPAFRWRHTDAALSAQVALAAEGHPGAVGPGHAGIRFTNPATGRDALATLRTEMHRLTAGTSTPVTRTVGSAVWQVFSGEGVAVLGHRRIDVATGDLVAVPSWQPLSFQAHTELDLFVFSDAPVYEALNLARTQVG